jgi:hypothetical protein
MLTNGAVLHHDNDQPHMAAAIAEMIWKLKYKLLPHPHTVHISTHVITTFLDHSKMHYTDSDLQMMKQSTTQCICCFVNNWKHSLQMASWSSWTEVTNVWKN